MDRFLQNRIVRFVQDWRQRSGELPTLQDFEASGLDRKWIDEAERLGLVEKFYVTLTSGTIKKGYKLGSKIASK